MANEIDLDFGTFNLDTASNVTIAEISIKESKTVKVSPIPKTDGAVAETGRRSHIVISVSGDVAGADYDTLRTNIDALKAALQNGSQKFTMDDDRYIMAQLQDFDYSYHVARTLAKWSAKFIAHYPFWLAESASESDKTEGVDITSGVGYTVNNPGNAPARVKVEFTAPGGGISDDIQLENTTLGQLLKYRGDVAAADVVEIDNRYDSDEFQVLNDGSDDIANFEGDFITLAPGDNTIEFTGAAGTAVKLTYRATYY